MKEACAGGEDAGVRPSAAPANTDKLGAECDGGDGEACLQLGLQLAYPRPGTGRPERERSLQLLQKACDGKTKGGCVHLGQVLLDLAAGSADSAADVARAREILSTACSAVGGYACTLLARALLEGKPSDADKAAATAHLDRECKASEPVACMHYGMLLYRGDVLSKDWARARELFKASCEGRFAAACRAHGQLLLEGQGGPKDVARALERFTEACDAGDVSACQVGVDVLAQGKGTAADVARSRAMLRRACDLGDSGSCDALDPKKGPTPTD